MATLYRKGISEDAKTSKISPFQARKVYRALRIIQSTPAKELIRSINVKKIKVSGRDDMYLYRVDMRQRIVLSIDKNKDVKIIHNIVDAGKLKANI